MGEQAENVPGVVKFFDVAKGYGFIKRDDGQMDVFVHVTDLRKSQIQELQAGDKVEFVVEQIQGKGPRATQVKRSA